MKLVDSSGWIAFLADAPTAEQYAGHLVDLAAVITPTIVLYEVYKIIKRKVGEEVAITAAAQLSQTKLVELSDTLALNAADVGLEHGLAMADAIVYATAQAFDAELITSDADFAELPGVLYIRPLQQDT